MNTQNGQQQQSRYLRLESGQPYTIALKTVAPREVQGNYGPQLLWILTDGKALYTPLALRDQIEKLNLKPYQPFVIQKTQNGQRAEWSASLPLKQPVAELLDASESLDSPVEVERPRTRLEDALKTAVSAAALAEKHGQAIGYNVRFAPSDIRAMGISVFIGLESRSGRAA